jgi:hypothetical protein
MGRGGSLAAYFGPCVSGSPETARTLLESFLATRPNEPVFWDLLPDNAAAVQLASEFGFRPVRKLVRMARPGIPAAKPFHSDNSKVFAIAGFEFG